MKIKKKDIIEDFVDDVIMMKDEMVKKPEKKKKKLAPAEILLKKYGFSK